MAFRNTTTGLTNINDVIDEIIDFAQNDLAAPWTLEYNLNATAGNVTSFTQNDTSRKTCVSKTMSQTGGNGFADTKIPNQPSPITADTMYVRLRNHSTPSVGMWTDGYSPSGRASPELRYFNPQGTNPWFEQSSVNLSPSTIAESGMEMNGSSGPFTQMWCFGPNQTSPEDPSIPNYVYVVVETEAGRYTHLAFGEWKKFVPFSGGWGCHGNDQNGNSTVDNSNNNTMWNTQSTSALGRYRFATDCNQGIFNFSTANTYSPQPSHKWAARSLRSSSGWNNTESSSQYVNAEDWGHTAFRSFMTGPTVSSISGFVPLGVPMVFQLDGPAGGAATNNADQDAPTMPMYYPADFYVGDITTFEPGVEVTIGGVTVLPFPITSKLGSGIRSNYGGYFYRKRA